MTGLKMITILHDLVEETQEPPSNAFTYAALAEMARIVDLSANRTSESPDDGILDAWLYIAENYYKLGHYLFALRYYDKVTDALKKYGASFSAADSMRNSLQNAFSNMLDIYSKMGNQDAAKELLTNVKNVLPSSLKAIQKPKPVFLNTDPVEYTEQYMTILPELEAKAEAAIIDESQNSEIYCFLYWKKKEEILKRDYGIDWESPAALNPTVMFN